MNTSELTISGNGSAESKLLRLKPRNTGTFAHTIYQDDLRRLDELSHALNAARDAYVELRDYIEQARRTGAVIEPGERDLVEMLRRGGGCWIEPWEKPGFRIVHAG